MLKIGHEYRQPDFGSIGSVLFSSVSLLDPLYHGGKTRVQSKTNDREENGTKTMNMFVA